jgi:thioredoxin-like negative regulator of GroEL
MISRPERRSIGAAMLAACVGCAACGSTPALAPAPAAPRASGEPAPPVHVHAFVSPYSYEWFTRAELLSLRGDYARAAEAYRNALAGADPDAYVLSRLADALDRGGDAAGAEQALGAGLAVDPQSEAIWLAHARIAQRHARTGDAIAAFERAESAAPQSPDAPLALSALLRAGGDPERADAVLERFAARSEHGSRGALRAQVELARARGDTASLAAAVRAWIPHAAGEPALAAALAADLLARGRPALAERLLEHVPEGERDPRLRLQLALALMQTEQVELLLAVEAPERLGGPLEIADAYLRIGRPERALRALEERASADEADPNRRALLQGLALLDGGQPARAALQLARVPAGSAYAPRARAALAAALRAGGLGALATEIAAR